MHSARLTRWAKCLAIVLAGAPAACGLTLSASGNDAPSEDAGTSSLDADVRPTSDAADTGEVLDASDASDASDAAAILQDHGALHLSSANAQDGIFAGLPIPDAFTIEVWIRLAALPTDQERYVFSKDRAFDSAYQFRFGVDTSGNVFFLMSDEDGNPHGLADGTNFSYTLITTTPMSLNAWTHLAVTHSGDATSLCVDGAPIKTIKSDISWVYGAASTVPTMFGARVGSAGGTTRNGNFDGDIDDLRVYSVARTAANIAVDRGQEIAASDADYASLVAYLKFDDGSGATALDATSMNDATLERAPTWLSSGAF